MNAVKTMRTLLFGAGTALALMAASPVFAQVNDGGASASALSAQLPFGLSVAPAPLSSVNGNGSDSDDLLRVTVFPFLDTGVLTTSAASNVDGSAGAKSASSTASILDFDLGGPLPFGLSFDVLTSNSNVSGDAGSFSAVGNSSIVNLMGSGLLAGLNGSALDGSANQVLFDGAGVSVIANRQTSSCSSFSCMLTTDALFINVANVAAVALATTSAHLAGNTAPVPEPSTWAMMIAGLFGIGAMRKWKNRSA